MIISVYGLGISLVGTLMLAFSIKKGKVKMYMDSSEQMEYASVFKPHLFRWGIALLAFGFFMQIYGELIKYVSRHW